MQDPLHVLRDHVMHKKPIHVEGNDIVFQNARFPKTTQTIFQNRNTKEKFTLEVLFFAYQHAESAHSVYIAACNKAGLKFISLADNKDLQAFLRGEIESSPSIDITAIAPAPAPVPQIQDEERQKKRQREENLQELDLDENLLEEKKRHKDRLDHAGPKAAFTTTAFGGDSTGVIEGMSKDTIELLKLKRMQKKIATIAVEENLNKKPAQKGFVKADAVITKKIVDRERVLSNRSSVLNTNGKKNFTDIIQAVTKSAKKEEEAKARLRDKNQKASAPTYDRYNVKEDQNWWKDKLKTNLEDFEIDTRGTFADGGLALDKAPPPPTSSSSAPSSASSEAATSSAPLRPPPSSRPPSSSAKAVTAKHSSSSSNSKPPPHGSTNKALVPSGFPSGPPPIIIVPSALTSLLTMYNAFDFLENGQYVNSMQRRGETSTKAPSVMVSHAPKIKGMPEKFQIVDNTTRMSSKDWSRVVAVFALGQAWQFKDWQWSSPVELFSNVKGFYLRCDDTQVPPEVKSWNVKILTISKTKRHLDKTAALEFWNTLEDFLARKIKH